jgi:endonuclease I
MMHTFKKRSLLSVLLFIAASTVAFFFIFTSASAQIPAGYYHPAKNKKQAELKTALKDLAYPQKTLDYGGGGGATWEGFYFADRRTENENGLIVDDMYSNTVRYFQEYSAVQGMHIEHSFPKSWWGGHVNDAYKDLFHLYPADGNANSAKNNFPLGEVLNPGFDNGVSKIGPNTFGDFYFASAFEPADEYKGDFARSYFYISTIYESFAHLWNSPMLDNNTYPVWKPWAIELLMKWHKQDPVSEKERNRQEAVYQIQGNRNPFIDYPDLADYIWGDKVNEVFPFPDETESFLLSPRQGHKIDFGIILTGNSKSAPLFLHGVNLNANIQLTLKKNSEFSLQKNTVSATEVLAGINVAILFNPQSAGNSRDTVVISGGGLQTMEIPVLGVSTTDFVLLEPTDRTPVGGTLHWIEDPDANSYLLNVYQGDKYAGDLIISAYIEGSSYNKAIEIYNGTGQTVDLSKYSLKKQSNGAGDFMIKHPLSGMLPDGKSYLIAHEKSTNTGLLQAADELTEDVLSFNGNDAVALYRDDLMIDIVGFANAGAEVMWGENLSLSRKPGVTHPFSKYNPVEWDVFPIDNLDMLHHHTMNLSDNTSYIIQNQNTGKNNFYIIENLIPQTVYTYSVEAVLPSGKKPSANTMQLHTAALEAPIIQSATDINEDSFYANWEENPYAETYLLNVYTLEGEQISETEGFDNVGSNGKPLPEGWSGTAGQTYTSTTSSGEKPPSMRLGNKEWLQTKTFSSPVTAFSFMYRYASASPGSSLLVEALANGEWKAIDNIAYVNTTKTVPSYTFSVGENVRSIRFTYTKAGSGYIAIDDVKTTFGSSNQSFIIENKPVAGISEKVEGLELNNVYYYNVRAVLGNVVSDFSESMPVYTEMGSNTNLVREDIITIGTSSGEISIYGLKGDEQVSIYSLTGICLFRSQAVADTLIIPFSNRGMYIVAIQNRDRSINGKKIIK